MCKDTHTHKYCQTNQRKQVERMLKYHTNRPQINYITMNSMVMVKTRNEDRFLRVDPKVNPDNHGHINFGNSIRNIHSLNNGASRTEIHLKKNEIRREKKSNLNKLCFKMIHNET